MTVKVLLKTRDAGETHNYLTGLDYGYSEIRGVMAVAQADPGQQWYGLPEDAHEADFDHAVRFGREAGEWEVAQTLPGYGMPTFEAAATWEAWLKRQPASDLRETLTDPETHPDTIAFIREWLGTD